ncbi:MAG: C39 family peptidase [Akkermansia sp.]|nr:C39 family peptidase [Akkermansia sp.]
MKTPIVLLSLLSAVGMLHAGDLTKSVQSGDFWSKTRNELSANVLAGVRYAPVDDSTIRVPRSGGLTMKPLNFGETVITWNEEECPDNMVIMVYNKGDDGALDKEAYEAMLAETIEGLNEITGVKGKARRSSKKDTGVALKSWVWEWENGVVQLDASYTGRKKDFEGEFLRLKMGPDKESISKGGAADAANRRELKANVKTDEESGDVWIDGVTMVDQGDKGYCVPATVARVFAYYGMDGVDQHALAQLCNSSGEEGTSTATMQTALEDISRKFHIRVQCLDGKSPTENILNFIADYNKAAKKLRKEMATPQNWVFVAKDKAVLLQARGNKKYVKKWMAAIKKNIDMGIPVLWSVQLGIFPEAGIPQNAGGHMRMIIGYNLKEQKILYSDSWGAGHEKKSMPANHAAAMTNSRYILRPSR